MIQFKKAQRIQTNLKIAITGPSGSGKTFSSLLLASGIGSKIALIDTENGSASLYSDLVEFDTISIDPPFTVDKYLEAIKCSIENKYDVLVIDSISHQWSELLEKKSKLDSGGTNSYTNWAKLTPEQDRFKNAILHSKIHMICTMRSKQDYVMQLNDKGKQAPIKVGLAPIQRDGMEYEFSTVFDVNMDHNASISKDRTGIFDGHFDKITKETGLKLIKWLSGGIVETEKKEDKLIPVESTAEVENPNIAKCEYCDHVLLFSEKKQVYYCSNWKDTTVEKHVTPFPKERFEEYLAYQADKNKIKEEDIQR